MSDECVVPECDQTTEDSLDYELCQDCWEDYSSFTYWKTHGGVVGPCPTQEDWLEQRNKV